jgi:adenine-specific DNA-methyltransferase
MVVGGITLPRKRNNTFNDELRLIKADVSVGLDLIEDGTVQLIITSPPYNVGKSYERDQAMSLEQYLKWLEPVAAKLCRKLTDHGSICWQVGNFVRNGELFPLDYYFYEIFLRNGLKLRNRIIWRFNFGLHATKRLSGRYETLLWFTKSENYTFNLDMIRVPQTYPGKRHAARKGSEKAGKPSGNPLGKNPSDFWIFTPEENFGGDPVWDIPNVKASHPEQTIHPCQFPHELAERCVLAFSKENDIILDPFIGAGTSAIAAIKAGRRSIGIDKCEEYIELTRQRVAALRSGSIKLRKSGETIRKPSSGEGVARRPKEWSEAAE